MFCDATRKGIPAHGVPVPGEVDVAYACGAIACDYVSRMVCAGMNRAIGETDLRRPEITFLRRIERNLAITADLSRADILMYVRLGRGYLIASQATPHSMAPIYAESMSGERFERGEAKHVDQVFATGRAYKEEVERWADRAPMVRQVYPVYGPQGGVIAAVSIETNLIEYERHKLRQAAFRRALSALQVAALSVEIPGVRDLISFGEQDGIVFVDAHRRIRYLSGIATNFYRKLGYYDPLVGRHVEYLETGDDELVSRALSEGRCFSEEARAHEREWVRQVLPLFGKVYRWDWMRHFYDVRRAADQVAGVFLMVHDETEARRRERELQVKSAMILETHHRVKNNLQTIAALLRLEARRVSSEEAKRALDESVNRILSIAVVHEFMANQGERLINLLEVGQRLVAHMRQMLMYPGRQIAIHISGPDIYLPAQQASVTSLVINELLQNAVEHGFADGRQGNVWLRLQETADDVIIEVTDDGAGLRGDFDLQRDGGVGLNIVQVLVRDDLKGELSMASKDGVTATVMFPKQV